MSTNVLFYITAGGAESLMYLRMRIGQPIGSKIKRDEMINTYGEANVKPDYWFIITQSRANAIFEFFHNISNEFRIYGVLDVMAIERAGLELVREGRDAIGKKEAHSRPENLKKSRQKTPKNQKTFFT